MIVVKFVNITPTRGSGEIQTWAEIRPDAMEFDGSERCFRFSSGGQAEYALMQDLIENGPRARWFGHVYTEKDFVFT